MTLAKKRASVSSMPRTRSRPSCAHRLSSEASVQPMISRSNAPTIENEYCTASALAWLSAVRVAMMTSLACCSILWFTPSRRCASRG
ncbi:hypothetical protein D3C72_1707190 [compost metagenome]